MEILLNQTYQGDAKIYTPSAAATFVVRNCFGLVADDLPEELSQEGSFTVLLLGRPFARS